MFGGRLAVAGQNHCAQAFVAQGFYHRRGLRTNVVAQNDSSNQLTFSDPDFGKGRLRWSAGLRHGALSDWICNGILPCWKPAFQHPFATSQQTFNAISFRAQTLARSEEHTSELQSLRHVV